MTTFKLLQRAFIAVCHLRLDRAYADTLHQPASESIQVAASTKLRFRDTIKVMPGIYRETVFT